MQQFHSLVTRNTGWFHKKNPVFEQKLDKRSIFLKIFFCICLSLLQKTHKTDKRVLQIRNVPRAARLKLSIGDFFSSSVTPKTHGPLACLLFEKLTGVNLCKMIDQDFLEQIKAILKLYMGVDSKYTNNANVSIF